MEETGTERTLRSLWTALAGDEERPAAFREVGSGSLASCFAVSDLASAAIGAAGLGLSGWCGVNGTAPPAVTVDRRLASAWFGMTLQPLGWSLPPVWDAIAGDYRTMDGWIRLHTNAPAHRAAVLAVVGAGADREAVAAAVAQWRGRALEAAIAAAGGAAATMMSAAEWAAHPQGIAVAAEPLLRRDPLGRAQRPEVGAFDPARPLAGIRVLDLTRVLAGPVAARFLAGYGAEVLRIDPPGFDEPNVAPEVTPGKRCARLNLRTVEGRDRLRTLLAGADIMVSGYRADALERLGLAPEERAGLSPGLVDVSLDAYGWTGPWRNRRGFDSLVQMSAGIARAGMDAAGADRPVPLPVQALDQATGYIMAAAALRGLTERRRTGFGSRWRTSLARVAACLARTPRNHRETVFDPVGAEDFARGEEETEWGPALRLIAPLSVGEIGLRFDRPAGSLGTARPEWS